MLNVIGDKPDDVALVQSRIMFGPDYGLMLGPHNTDNGWCWCQPRIEELIHFGKGRARIVLHKEVNQ